MIKQSNIQLHAYLKGLSLLVFLSLFTSIGYGQSAKKYLENGFYEQAFYKAVRKQNKKVKLKKKYAGVIYKSYETIYEKNSTSINSADSDWNECYNRMIRVVSFRAMVKHPGVYENLQNMLYDRDVIDPLAIKYNNISRKELNEASDLERNNEFEKAIVVYKRIAARQKQIDPIKPLKDIAIGIDTEFLLEEAHRKAGDKYMKEAQELIHDGSKESATKAISFIQKAKSFRPLSIEDEQLLKLANLILSDSWVSEAQNLLQTRTKRNARLAHDLLNQARGKRALTEEEEKLQEEALFLGMTRVLIKVKGKPPVHTSERLSGHMNKKKASKWVTYFYNNSDGLPMDFELEVAEKQPTVVLGDTRKQVKQHTKTVEYWEEETDAEGNTVKVKKTRIATALVATLSRTKTAQINWAIILKDLTDNKAFHSESRETKEEITHQSASLESGDVLAMPENVESDIDLDSQPFPTDKEMTDKVISVYLRELEVLLNLHNNHLRNIDAIIQ